MLTPGDGGSGDIAHLPTFLHTSILPGERMTCLSGVVGFLAFVINIQSQVTDGDMGQGFGRFGRKNKKSRAGLRWTISLCWYSVLQICFSRLHAFSVPKHLLSLSWGSLSLEKKGQKEGPPGSL